MRKLGFPKEATPEDVEKYNKLRNNLPDIPEGSLGTCAIVANSDNLLKAQRGKEIDAHDTVFRHNTPTRGFEKNVGKKTAVVIVKSNYKSGGGGAGKAQGSGAKPSIAYMLLKNVEQLPKSLKVDGKPALLRAGGAHPIARLRRELYALYGGVKSGSIWGHERVNVASKVNQCGVKRVNSGKPFWFFTKYKIRKYKKRKK